jgi:thiosulfate reductase cytochrome b subunit
MRFKLKHTLATRWFHWVNFPLLFIMIWSGMLIYWADDVYYIGKDPDHPIFHFFPDAFYAKMDFAHRLSEGMAWHFFFMWLFAINGFLYVGYTLLSGEWRALVPDRKCWAQAFAVVLHDLHLRKELPPQGKFNAAQRISYTGIVCLGFLSLVTGLAIYKPVQVAPLTNLLGGYYWARTEHFVLTLSYLAFFVVHVSQVVKAGWNNFRSMVVGYEAMPAGAPTGARELEHPPLD